VLIKYFGALINSIQQHMKHEQSKNTHTLNEAYLKVRPNLSFPYHSFLTYFLPYLLPYLLPSLLTLLIDSTIKNHLVSFNSAGHLYGYSRLNYANAWKLRRSFVCVQRRRRHFINSKRTRPI